jgi:hypothetical protein
LLCLGIGLTAVTADAANPDLTDARLDGYWNLSVHIAGYVNTPPPASLGLPIGLTGTARVKIVPICSGIAPCNLNVLPAGPGQATGDPASAGFVAPGAGPYEILARTGSIYALLPGGYGGNSNCSATPTRDTRFGYSLTLNVINAVPDLGGWRATEVSGSGLTLIAKCINGTIQVFDLKVTVDNGVYVPNPTSATLANADQAPISTALATPAQSFRTPTHALVNAVAAVALMLFITFPAQLFNKTLDENYLEISGWFRRRFGSLAKLLARRPGADPGPRRRFWFVTVLLTGAVLGSLLNPKFGLNRTSAAGFTATILAILWGIMLSQTVGHSYRRARHKPIRRYLKALPGGLLVAALCVLISRVSDFQPGYLYGIVAGIAFEGKLAKHEDGHVVVLSTTATITAAVLAWLIWVPVHAAASTPGAAIGIVIGDDLLASIVVGGLVGSVVGMLPLRFMPGGTLVSWHRGAWAGTFSLALFGLLQVVVRPETGGHGGTAPTLSAILLFGLFGGASIAFWAYFRRRKASALKERQTALEGVPFEEEAILTDLEAPSLEEEAIATGREELG